MPEPPYPCAWAYRHDSNLNGATDRYRLTNAIRPQEMYLVGDTGRGSNGSHYRYFMRNSATEGVTPRFRHGPAEGLQPAVPRPIRRVAGAPDIP